VDIDVGLAIEVSIAEVTEADKRVEQKAVSVTVAVTVITQEAGHVCGHAAANGENATIASTNVRMEGDIIEYSRWVTYV
jgi:hypothetical protein